MIANASKFGGNSVGKTNAATTLAARPDLVGTVVDEYTPTCPRGVDQSKSADDVGHANESSPHLCNKAGAGSDNCRTGWAG